VRRFLSISLICLFWIAPLSALMPGSEDARLPMCCRRHGAHHCAMMSGREATSAAGEHVIAAPAHCPAYRITAPATLPPFLLSQMLAARPAVRQHLELAPTPIAFLPAIGHAHSGRAPPSSL
jgi:hypothetical protein